MINLKNNLRRLIKNKILSDITILAKIVKPWKKFDYLSINICENKLRFKK